AFFISNLDPMKFWDFVSLILEGLGYQRILKIQKMLIFYPNRPKPPQTDPNRTSNRTEPPQTESNRPKPNFKPNQTIHFPNRRFKPNRTANHQFVLQVKQIGDFLSYFSFFCFFCVLFLFVFLVFEGLTQIVFNNGFYLKSFFALFNYGVYSINQLPLLCFLVPVCLKKPTTISSVFGLGLVRFQLSTKPNHKPTTTGLIFPFELMFYFFFDNPKDLLSNLFITLLEQVDEVRVPHGADELGSVICLVFSLDFCFLVMDVKSMLLVILKLLNKL
ncbi:hypothetical protein UlMin_028624, partial [Ulmus minor]